jgi:hypothetical protein
MAAGINIRIYRSEIRQREIVDKLTPGGGSATQHCLGRTMKRRPF